MANDLIGYQRRLALYAICATLAVVLLVAIPLSQSTKALTDSSADRVTDVSDVSANSISVELNSISSLMQTTSARDAFVNPGPYAPGDERSAVRTELRNLKASSGNIRSAFLLDALGNIKAVEPADATNIGMNRSSRDYFIGALRTPSSSYVSEAYIAKLPDDPRVVSVAHAVTTPATPTEPAKVIGVLVASVDASSVFQPYVDGLANRRGMNVAIFDQHSQLVAGPHAKRSVVERSDDMYVQDATHGKSATVVTGEGSEQEAKSYSPVGNTGWVVVADASGDEVFGAVHALQVRVITTATILGLLLFAGYFAFSRTMRGQAKARSEVVRSEARTRSIIETAAQAFMEFDEDGTIIQFNKEAERLFGWDREDIVGMKNPPIQSATVADHLRQQFTSFLEEHGQDTTEAFRAESSIIRRDGGEAVPVEVTLWRTEFDAELRINCFMQDISERHRLDAARNQILERQRELVDELRKADKTKGDFMSTVSHELRTPLTSIIGYLEMLQDGYGGELTDRQGSMLDVVNRNSHRLLSLIEDLLTLSRIEAGSFRLDLAPVDVDLLLSSVRQSFVPHTIERSIDLHIDVATGTGAVMGDAHQLERVMMNLLSNALKFTPEGGAVNVVARRSGDDVVIEVADNGIGIAVDEQKRLFNRFFRASSANANAIQGTGLGLAIVKGIVDGHGGTISLASVLGKGTTVSVTLPTPQKANTAGSYAGSAI